MYESLLFYELWCPRSRAALFGADLGSVAIFAFYTGWGCVICVLPCSRRQSNPVTEIMAQTEGNQSP
jgi:hypothetical protein